MDVGNGAAAAAATANVQAVAKDIERLGIENTHHAHSQRQSGDNGVEGMDEVGDDNKQGGAGCGQGGRRKRGPARTMTLTLLKHRPSLGMGSDLDGDAPPVAEDARRGTKRVAVSDAQQPAEGGGPASGQQQREQEQEQRRGQERGQHNQQQDVAVSALRSGGSAADKEQDRSRKRARNDGATTGTAPATTTAITPTGHSKAVARALDQMTWPEEASAEVLADALAVTEGGAIHVCPQCELPILVYGRMEPCHHALCAPCTSRCVRCPQCGKDIVQVVEIADVTTMFMCHSDDIGGGGGGDTTTTATRNGGGGGKTCGLTFRTQHELFAHVAAVHQSRSDGGQAVAGGADEESHRRRRSRHRSADTRTPTPAAQSPPPRHTGHRPHQASSSRHRQSPKPKPQGHQDQQQTQYRSSHEQQNQHRQHHQHHRQHHQQGQNPPRRHHYQDTGSPPPPVGQAHARHGGHDRGSPLPSNRSHGRPDQYARLPSPPAPKGFRRRTPPPVHESHGGSSGGRGGPPPPAERRSSNERAYTQGSPPPTYYDSGGVGRGTYAGGRPAAPDGYPPSHQPMENRRYGRTSPELSRRPGRLDGPPMPPPGGYQGGHVGHAGQPLPRGAVGVPYDDERLHYGRSLPPTDRAAPPGGFSDYSGPTYGRGDQRGDPRNDRGPPGPPDDGDYRRGTSKRHSYTRSNSDDRPRY
eukprot:m.356177 g.356177  ORF g.356177 m.356177 type:complete len:696 (+) comp19929_c3_seq2:313-2400(+)